MRSLAKAGLGIGIAFAVLIAIGAAAPREQTKDVEVPAVAPAPDISSQKPTPVPTVKERLIADITDALHNQNIKIEFSGTDTNNVIKVTVPSDINQELGADTFVEMSSDDALTAFEKVFTNNEYDNVSKMTVAFNITLVDAFGKTTEAEGFGVTLTRSTAEKIQDWETVRNLAYDNPIGYYRKIMNVEAGDDLNVHPVILKDIILG